VPYEKLKHNTQIKSSSLRQFCKIAKSDCDIRHVYRSVSLHGTTRPLLEGL